LHNNTSDSDATGNPRWFWGWNVVALTLVMQSISVGILVYCYALFAVPWIDEFGASRRDAMLAVSLLQLAGGLLSPFAGRLMAWMPMRRLIIIGACLQGLGLALASQATQLWQIVALYSLLLPFGNVLCGTLASQTLVTHWFLNRRGMAIGISAMGTSLGGFLFPQIADALVGSLGWREAMLVLGVTAVLAIVPLALLVLSRKPPARATEGTDAKPTQTSATTGNTASWSTRQTIMTMAFWLPACAIVPLNSAFGAVQFNLGAYTRDLGFESGTAAWLISITSIAMICGKFAFGTLSDRIDHRVLYWIAAGFLCAALMALQFTPALPRMTMGVAMLGIATGSVIPLTAVIFASRFGDAQFSRVMGLAQMIFMLGAMGPIVAGWVYDATGSYDPAFFGLVLFTVPFAVAMYWLPAPGSKHTANSRS